MSEVLEASEVLEVSKVLEMLEVLELPAAPEVMRRVLLCMLEAAEGRRCLLEMPDTLCAALYAGGCGRWALFAGGAGYAVCYSVCWT